MIRVKPDVKTKCKKHQDHTVMKNIIEYINGDSKVMVCWRWNFKGDSLSDPSACDNCRYRIEDEDDM